MFKLQKNISLKPYTTFKIGGRAEYFLKAKTKDDVLNAVSWASKNKIPFLVLGSGSNVLFTKGFKGLVIINGLTKISKNKNYIFAESGVLISELLNFYLKNKLRGLEWSAGLPGTLGGAIRGNAGAFKGEMKSSILEVESFFIGKNGVNTRLRPFKSCLFGYRKSVFENNGEIILSAKLKMKKVKSIIAAEEEAKSHINYRKKFQPLEYPNAGSIFKNIPVSSVNQRTQKIFKNVVKIDPFPVVPAAAVIDKIGLKGKFIGGAQISQKHPNFIINKNRASANEIIQLKKLMENKAKKGFKIILEEEIKIIN